MKNFDLDTMNELGLNTCFNKVTCSEINSCLDHIFIKLQDKVFNNLAI